MYENVRTVLCPMASVDALRKRGDKPEQYYKFNRNNIPYRQAIGSLLYLANTTRPDIAFAVNVLSRKQENFDYYDWSGVKQIFRYLRGTLGYGIKFTGKKEGIDCYPDASLGISEPDRKSTTGYAIKLYGDIICWRTKRQTQVVYLRLRQNL